MGGIDGSSELRVAVNFDFSYLSGVSFVETTDASYELIMALGQDTVDSLVQAGDPSPNLSAFPVGRSSYQILAGTPSAHSADLNGVVALCAYYDANQKQLMAAYQQRQADEAAKQQWLLTHPPSVPNTTVNYWPIKSRVYLGSSQ